MLQPIFGQLTPSSFTRPANAVQRLLFSGTSLIQRPTTISDSFERESSVFLEGGSAYGFQLLNSLIARMDEAMTVTGEKYSGNEAFTTQFHVKMTPEGQAALKQGNSLPARVDRRMEWTKGVFMAMSGSVTDALTDSRLADVRSMFCSIDPASVPSGKNKPKALTTELQVSEGNADDVAINTAAAEWNKSYQAALRPVEQRLVGYKDREKNVFVPGEEVIDVKDLPISDLRATDANFYVPTEMVNKKQTGHGGVSVAKAVQGMMVLAARNFGGKKLGSVKLEEFTASYKLPFVMDHGLQADTTVDHVDKDGNVYLSTRLYKCDTKGWREQDRAALSEAEREQDGFILTGPVTIIHAKIKAPKTISCKPNVDRFNAMLGELEGKARTDAETRQKEAIGWSKIKF